MCLSLETRPFAFRGQSCRAVLGLTSSRGPIAADFVFAIRGFVGTATHACLAALRCVRLLVSSTLRTPYFFVRSDAEISLAFYCRQLASSFTGSIRLLLSGASFTRTSLLFLRCRDQVLARYSSDIAATAVIIVVREFHVLKSRVRVAIDRTILVQCPESRFKVILLVNSSNWGRSIIVVCDYARFD